MPDKLKNFESLNNYTQQVRSSSTNVLIVCEDLLRVFCKLFYLWVCDLSHQWKIHCVAKILLAISEIYFQENNVNCNFYRLKYKFTFMPLLSFVRNQTRIKLSASWWSGKKIFLFLVYSESFSTSKHANSIGFYKGFFLHIIPFRIIVLYCRNSVSS